MQGRGGEGWEVACTVIPLHACCWMKIFSKWQLGYINFRFLLIVNWINYLP